MRECILHRGTAMPGNDDKKKAFLLLSNCRSPTLSKEELKLGCLYRLSLPITDEHVSIIFNHFDKNNTGQILLKQLVEEVMKEKMEYEAKFQNTLDLSRSSKPGSLANASNQYGPLPSEEAYMKFDKTFHNLEEPSSRYLINKMTLQQLEEAIRDKVYENCKQNTNLLQALSRAFGDNRDRDSKFKVTLNQMKYTIWKKLMIYAGAKLIESLFMKYDPKNTGYVNLHDFADGVMKKTINYKPLVEEKNNKFAMKIRNGDAHVRFGQVYSPLVVSFLEHMRSKMKDYVNNNCRSPAYLVHSTNRMNPNQAKKFLEDQFNVVVGDNVINELVNEYDDNGLLNMKRLLKDCMIVDLKGKLGLDVNLITSSAINVDEMPLSVRSNRQGFEFIQRMFREKIEERVKNDQPLSYLHLMFRSKENDKDPRLISKQGLRKVLYKQDITLSDADYDDYFSHFDRGDGKVVIRDFLLELNFNDKNIPIYNGEVAGIDACFLFTKI
jgi:Ca2+-binding EF-hand superfamily protein